MISVMNVASNDKNYRMYISAFRFAQGKLCKKSSNNARWVYQ